METASATMWNESRKRHRQELTDASWKEHEHRREDAGGRAQGSAGVKGCQKTERKYWVLHLVISAGQLKIFCTFQLWGLRIIHSKHDIVCGKMCACLVFKCDVSRAVRARNNLPFTSAARGQRIKWNKTKHLCTATGKVGNLFFFFLTNIIWMMWPFKQRY